MARPVKWPPRVRRHAGGQARVRFRGKDYYLGPFGSLEAMEAFARFLADHDPARKPPADGVRPGATVRECHTAWVAHLTDRLGAESGEVENARFMLKDLTDLYGSSPARGFDARDLRLVRDGMIARGLSRRTISEAVNRVRRMWRWLEFEGYVGRGAADSLKTLPALSHRAAPHRPRRQPATEDAVRAVAAKLQPHLGDCLLLIWHTGMRPKEALTLRPGDVEPMGDGTHIYVPGRADRLFMHKTGWRGVGKEIVIGPRGWSHVEPYLADTAATEYVYRPSRSPRCKPKIGPCYQTGSFCKCVAKAARKAGQPGFTAYLCRYATERRVERAFDVESARCVLGHQNLQTTSIYSRLDTEEARRAMKEIG